MAFTAGVIKIQNDGSFEFYDSEIYNNYAYSNIVSEMIDSGEDSVISNCKIHDNFDLVDSWQTEIYGNCSKL